MRRRDWLTVMLQPQVVVPAELWSAPAPVRSSSAGAPGAASVWPAAAAGLAAPVSGWTD